MLAKRTAFLVVGILAMVSLGVLVGTKISGTEAGGGTKVAYALLTKQPGFKTAGMVIFEQLPGSKLKVDFNAVMVPNPGAHMAHVHKKVAGVQCSAGAVLVNLSNVTVNANGVIAQKKTVSGNLSDVIGNVVVLHDKDGKYVGCGPVRRG